MSQTEWIAYNCGKWQATADVSLALDDWGSLQGATLVERLRTVNGKPLDVVEHLERLRESSGILGIQWPTILNDSSLIEECVDRNRRAHKFPDFAVVVLLTPGRAHVKPAGSAPTLIVHTGDLNWSALAQWYAHGQALIVSDNRNVPGNCWSPHIKSRSRLHYFLADQQAASSPWKYAGAAMLAQDGSLTESSVSNLLIVEQGVLISPPIDTVLHGLSLRRTLRLADQLGIECRYETISIERAKRAEEMLLTGSSGCFWPACRLDDVEYAEPLSRPVCQKLTEAWRQDLGLDFTTQAIAVTAK